MDSAVYSGKSLMSSKGQDSTESKRKIYTPERAFLKVSIAYSGWSGLITGYTCLLSLGFIGTLKRFYP